LRIDGRFIILIRLSCLPSVANLAPVDDLGHSFQILGRMVNRCSHITDVGLKEFRVYPWVDCQEWDEDIFVLDILSSFRGLDLKFLRVLVEGKPCPAI